MATCETCDREMLTATGCTGLLSSTRLPLVAYGDERNPRDSGARCRDCSTPRGGLHHAFCAGEECSNCHGQRLMCGSVDCADVLAERERARGAA